MTRQEKLVIIALLGTLLLGAAVRSVRRGAADSTHPALKSSSISP